MSLAAAYESLANTDSPFPQCKTCIWYLALDPDDKSFFDQKVADDEEARARLRKACKTAGLNVAPSSFRNHVINHHPVLVDLS